MNILTVNLLLSTLCFWIAARLYALPRLHEWKPRTVLLPILLLTPTSETAAQRRRILRLRSIIHTWSRRPRR